MYGHNIPMQAPIEKDYDAIIVLTGGESRIDYGMNLLKGQTAPKLFISGVADGYSVKETSHITSEHVEYGEKARDTLGNAAETMDWLSGKPYQHILIVTANYHMQRTKLIFEHYLSAYTLGYAPVEPPKFQGKYWLSHENSRRLVMSEYHKYLITWLRFVILNG